MIPRFVIFLILSIVLTINSCDTSRTINPFEEEVFAYSIYGAVELQSDENYIRVRNVNEPFLADSGVAYKNITVKLEDISSSDDLAIRPTYVDFNDNFTLNYLIEDELEPRETYDFSISNQKGETVRSEFTMPGISTVRLNRTVIENCFQEIRFTWDNVNKPEYILVEAGARYEGVLYWGEVRRVDEPDHIPGENKMEMELSINQLLVDIFPPSNVTVSSIESWRPEVMCHQLDSKEIYIRYIHFGPDWEQFEESSYFHNDYHETGEVENGYGFLGGIYRDSFIIEFK